ncbi:iron-sulfur cluster assembly protein 1-like isoform X4 [Hordeum vulgare subsp. vulgare]|uniref:iron-sulfur cluster assembly protein 1-like isoform X4 n=1 Tax=Hordeum vulgare subsp. vulgare TaxID=112509 RepID=UPI001D1A4324|nr:iron-sulfur cluster assembly protein 1-like isoform X4 [Hordeum vulgare subsp. vulgare]
MMLRAAGKRLVGAAAASAGDYSSSVAEVTLGAVAARRGYHERVVDHYSNPRNVGEFDKDDVDVGTGLVGAPACGDVMNMQIRVDQASGRIVDACFKTFGCGSAIASSSVVVCWCSSLARRHRFCCCLFGGPRYPFITFELLDYLLLCYFGSRFNECSRPVLSLSLSPRSTPEKLKPQR